MQFVKYILILCVFNCVSFQIADDAPKKGGTLGLSIKGGVITIAGSDKPLSPSDNVQAATTVPEPPAPAPAAADQTAPPTPSPDQTSPAADQTPAPAAS